MERPTWLAQHFKQGRFSQEAGGSLFQGIRIRLTLWYCGVLAVALVLFGTALYLSTQYFLLTPIKNDATGHAQAHMDAWLAGAIDRACPLTSLQNPFGPSGQRFLMPEMVVCFNQDVSLLPGENTGNFPSAFLNSSLAKRALQTGLPVDDEVDGGGSYGKIYRYAVAVPGPTGDGYQGVIVIGESIQVQENELSLLLVLLLSIGGVALLGAGAGGLFLANRALEPARLAWTNQQRFIADASHELRTPLTLLRADAEVLLRGRERLDVEDSTLIEDIVAETDHMTTLANNMLTLARLDSHSNHYEHEVLNLADIASKGARRLQALANQAGVSIQVESSGLALVVGDTTLLEQAVLAVLDNSIKYNRRGGNVLLRTTVQDEHALLEVTDTGIGIAAEHLPHLGERFYRVDKARSREAGGTGLGFSIARNSAIALGGYLDLSSTPGKGTTVTFILPLAHEKLRARVNGAGGRSSHLEQTM